VQVPAREMETSDSAKLQNKVSYKICSLFNDAVSNSEHIVLSGRMITELGRIWKGALMA
jgi:hypothetical protein